MKNKKSPIIKGYSTINPKILPSIKFSTLHQIIRDLKLNYFIHKNKAVIYANEIDDFKAISNIARECWFYETIIYAGDKRRWVSIIGEREGTSDKTYKLYDKIFKEVISKIQ